MFSDQINKFLVLVFFLLAVPLFINCGGSQGNSSLPPTDEKPIVIQAGDLIKEYRENSATADEKYKGKLIAVTGKTAGSFDDGNKILWIGVNESGLTNFSDPDPKGVECGNGDLTTTINEKIELGQEIVLIGINQGMQPGITQKDYKQIVLKTAESQIKLYPAIYRMNHIRKNFLKSLLHKRIW